MESILPRAKASVNQNFLQIGLFGHCLSHLRVYALTMGKEKFRLAQRHLHVGPAAIGLCLLYSMAPLPAAAQLTTSATTTTTKPKGASSSATASASATILQQISSTNPTVLDTGDVVGGTKSPGTIAIPASYFGGGTPAPTYTNITASTAKGALLAQASQITITGAPNLSFTVSFKSWKLTSSTASVSKPAVSNTVSFYFANTKTTSAGPSAQSTLSSKGSALVGIGSTVTVTLAKGATGRVTYTPTVAVAYN